jgi:Flp pilus assembly protein TadG
MAAHRARPARDLHRGQAVAEFALALIPLLFLVFGVFDLGRAIYLYNSTAEAAREIARVTSVHPYDTCCAYGSSTQAQAVIADQKAAIPGLTASGISVSCVDIADAPIADASCRPGDFMKVTVSVTWTPATPLLAALGDLTVSSVSRMELQ